MKVQIDDQVVRNLYKSSSSCADHHSLDLVKSLHIRTEIDDAIVLASKQNKVVIVTGEPGDGKTHIIRQNEESFPKKMVINKDANEHEDDELIKLIDRAFTSKAGLIVAMNEGILLGICEKAKKRTVWAKLVIDAILKPYVYDSGQNHGLENILILDLNLRNNLSKSTVEQAIEKVVSLCDKKGPLYPNAKKLVHPVIKSRLTFLLDAIGKTGFHATMRDLLGFIAFLICGGEENDNQPSPKPYYINAFEGGIGPLFEMIREFDPLRMPHPFLDDDLYMCQDKNTDWEIISEDEVRQKEDLPSFQQRKRRAFFEHKRGDTILREERNEVDKYFDLLRSKEQSPELVAIKLLNRFFNSRESQNDNLTLWVSHQFHAKPIRFVASRQSTPFAELQILVPRLPGHLSAVFLDHYPDHVILKHKSMDVSSGLVMDRRLVKMLLEGDRQNGIGTRNLEAQLKISSFYDRLGLLGTNQQPIVQILRLDNMAKASIGVNLSTRSYFVPGG